MKQPGVAAAVIMLSENHSNIYSSIYYTIPYHTILRGGGLSPFARWDQTSDYFSVKRPPPFVCSSVPLMLAGSLLAQCKHLLAVRLAPALGVSCLEEVDDQRLADRIGDCAYG